MQTFISEGAFLYVMNEPQDLERAMRARKRIHQNLQDIERKLDHLLMRIREADGRINAGLDEWNDNDSDEEA